MSTTDKSGNGSAVKIYQSKNLENKEEILLQLKSFFRFYSAEIQFFCERDSIYAVFLTRKFHSQKMMDRLFTACEVLYHVYSR